MLGSIVFALRFTCSDLNKQANQGSLYFSCVVDTHRATSDYNTFDSKIKRLI